MKIVIYVAIGILLGGLMLDSALILKRYGRVDLYGNMFKDRVVNEDNHRLVGLPVVGTEPVKEEPKFRLVRGKDTSICKKILNVNYISNEVARCTIDHWEAIK